jgi:hypothetical protein
MLTDDAAVLVARSNSSKAMGSVARVLTSVHVVLRNEFRNHSAVALTPLSEDDPDASPAAAASGNCAMGASDPSRHGSTAASSS